jgi:phage tail sheath gpL-like
MGDILFENIPVDILTPGTFVDFDNSQANQGLALMPHRILVTGQKLAAGTRRPQRQRSTRMPISR